MVMYARINTLNRIIELSNTAFDGYIEVLNEDVQNNPQNYKYTGGGIFALSIQPSLYHSLDANGDWYLNNELLQNAIFSIKQEIKSYRDERLRSGGYPTSVGWFHSDSEAQLNYEDLWKVKAQLAAMPDNAKNWKKMDGTFVLMSESIVNEIFNAKVTQKSATFLRAEEHIYMMSLSNDPYNYNYKTGWPPIYGE